MKFPFFDFLIDCHLLTMAEGPWEKREKLKFLLETSVYSSGDPVSRFTSFCKHHRKPTECAKEKWPIIQARNRRKLHLMMPTVPVKCTSNISIKLFRFSFPLFAIFLQEKLVSLMCFPYLLFTLKTEIFIDFVMKIFSYLQFSPIRKHFAICFYVHRLFRT